MSLSKLYNFRAVAERMHRNYTFLRQCGMPLSSCLSSGMLEKDPRNPEDIGLKFSTPRDLRADDPEQALYIVPINLEKLQTLRREAGHPYTKYKAPEGKTGDFGSTDRVFRNLVYSSGNMELPLISRDDKNGIRVAMGNHRLQIMETVYGFKVAPVVVQGRKAAEDIYKQIGAKGDYFTPSPYGSVIYRDVKGNVRYSHDTDGLKVRDDNYAALKQTPASSGPEDSLPQLTYSQLDQAAVNQIHLTLNMTLKGDSGKRPPTQA